MKNWLVSIILGIVFVLMGILTMFNPFPASMAVEILAGWSFMILGMVLISAVFQKEKAQRKNSEFILGFVSVILGFSLLFKPLSGLITLTLMLGILFVISGVFRVFFARIVLDPLIRWTIYLTAFVSVILGLTVLVRLPSSAMYSLGIYLGIEQISFGVSSAMIGFAQKNWQAQHNIRG